MFGNRKNPQLSKAQAFKARPVKVPVLSEELKEGKLLVTVEYERPGWQRVLGADRHCKRTFGLDEYGQEVYGYCTGSRTVLEIIKEFAEAHEVSHAESEAAVTAFLKTLMSRGLVGMEMSRRE
jgi:hypothetical protein